jgi:hypothetical protein
MSLNWHHPPELGVAEISEKEQPRSSHLFCKFSAGQVYLEKMEEYSAESGWLSECMGHVTDLEMTYPGSFLPRKFTSSI